MGVTRTFSLARTPRRQYDEPPCWSESYSGERGVLSVKTGTGRVQGMEASLEYLRMEQAIDSMLRLFAIKWRLSYCPVRLSYRHHYFGMYC